MSIPFLKMSGAGNDFVVIGAAEAEALGARLPEWTRAVARRGLSVGSDGVLVVTPSGRDRVALRFLNPDGGEAFCGNGTRCAARYAHLRGLTGRRLVVETCAGPIAAEVRDGTVRLEVPVPKDRGRTRVENAGTAVEGRFVDAGSPHFVIRADDVAAWPLAERAPWIRRHPAFGDAGVNVDVVAERPDGSLRIRTWERGVEGETLSCGSGALAAARLAIDGGRRGRIRIVPASGIELVVDVPQDVERAPSVGFEGDARVVFEGVLSPEAALPEKSA
jgi:diaminopimelate epimerase